MHPFSCFPAPPGRSVPPAGFLRQDYDSEASPRALHHNDGDDEDDDDEDNDYNKDDDYSDSNLGGVRSPSASSASDSSCSASKPGMCFCDVWCQREKPGDWGSVCFCMF